MSWEPRYVEIRKSFLFVLVLDFNCMNRQNAIFLGNKLTTYNYNLGSTKYI